VTAERLTVEAALAACFAGFLSFAQRHLSTPVRTVRRRVRSVSGTVVFNDGTEEAIDAETLRLVPEQALQAMTVAVVALAASLVVLRLT
jgi:hypothetical protein